MAKPPQITVTDLKVAVIQSPEMSKDKLPGLVSNINNKVLFSTGKSHTAY